jgi:hypothetical protein
MGQAILGLQIKPQNFFENKPTEEIAALEKSISEGLS